MLLKAIDWPLTETKLPALELPRLTAPGASMTMASPVMIELRPVVKLPTMAVKSPSDSACATVAAPALPRVTAAPCSRSTLIGPVVAVRSEEHTSELQSLMRISYAVFCLKKKTKDQHRKT